jgi:predicted dienelactone hydrolase
MSPQLSPFTDSASYIALLQAVFAKIDTSRICTAGHSFGAATALLFSKNNASQV